MEDQIFNLYKTGDIYLEEVKMFLLQFTLFLLMYLLFSLFPDFEIWFQFRVFQMVLLVMSDQSLIRSTTTYNIHTATYVHKNWDSEYYYL